MNVFASVVKLVHIAFVAFVVLTPFIGNELALTYHFITIPFLVLHWWTNNDTCALTLLEAKITGVKDDQTFIGRIIKPIYNAHLGNRHYYYVVGVLYLITVLRLYYQYHFWYAWFTWHILMVTFKKLT